MTDVAYYARVARAVPRSRRRPDVPFDVHAEVAELSPVEQSRWLRLAVAEGWGPLELRAALRGAR